MTKPPRQWNSTLPQRSRPPKRSGRPKRKARSKQEFKRIYGPMEFGDFVRSLPCAACGVVGFSVQAHIGKEGKGTGRKANWDQTGPLCHSRVAFAGTLYSPRAIKSIKGCHEQFDDAELTLDVPRVLADVQRLWASRSPAPSPTTTEN